MAALSFLPFVAAALAAGVELANLARRKPSPATWLFFAGMAALAAEQHNFFDPPRRCFWIEATRGTQPLDGLYACGEADASMRIRLLSLVQVVRVSGPPARYAAPGGEYAYIEIEMHEVSTALVPPGHRRR